ncbi:MAG: histidine kinase [Rhodobiaceae bacterium]|nr:histidine kinase [Rhodobiaceae bacterium]
MPSLFRFLIFCAVLGGIVFGGMLALDLLVKPVPREMSERVSIGRTQQ